MKYWLIKSEPDCYSFHDLKKDTKTLWTDVRNYQARNFMRDQMKVGDKALFWHSGTVSPAAVGVARVSKEAIPEEDVWVAVEFSYEKTFNQPVTLSEIKKEAKLRGIMVAQRGSRLSIQPVTRQHFDHIVNIGMTKVRPR